MTFAERFESLALVSETQTPEPYDLTPAQAGELIGVSGNTIKRWVEERRLAALKLPNGYLRFRRSDIDEFMENSRVVPVEAVG